MKLISSRSFAYSLVLMIQKFMTNSGSENELSEQEPYFLRAIVLD